MSSRLETRSPWGDDCGQCKNYTDLFGAWVQQTTGHRVVVEKLSQHDNLTAARMAEELPRDSGQTQAVESADVVLLDIGFNDTPWKSIDDTCDVPIIMGEQWMYGGQVDDTDRGVVESSQWCASR